jgi:acetyl-CoA/propionyl-CoA carboxylase, biotin carboxylase, biotin carboxyl carrier protein
VRPVASTPGRLRLEIDGAIEEFQVEADPHAVTVGHHGEAHVFRRPAAFAHETAATADGSLLAPMPGTVLSVAAAAGAPVRAGDALVVIEAMKMELALTAPFDGAVTTLNVEPGDQVKLGQVLVEVAPDA